MSFLKIFGGIAAGIGAVACLPVAGPIGAVTLLGAIVGGSIGGVLGKKMSDKEKTKENALLKKIEELKKETEQSKFYNALEVQVKNLTNEVDYYSFFIALIAITLATANVDGNISSEEQSIIDNFKAEISKMHIPGNVATDLNKIINNPPDFVEAFVLIKKLKYINWELFRETIVLVANADGIVCTKEKALLASFDKLVNE